MLKAVVENLDEVDSKYHDLYVQRDGKWVLDKIDGLVSQGDLTRIQSGLTNERNAHKETKAELDRYKVLGDDVDAIQVQLDSIPELKLAADGKLDDEKINGIVETRLRAKVAPVEREMEKIRKENEDLRAENEGHKVEKTRRTIHDAVRTAASESKIVSTAVDDALMLAERVFEVTDDGQVVTRDSVGVTPGIAPQVWLTELQDTRPHWWEASSGGGAKPGQGTNRGVNPFSDEHWNRTEQGKLFTTDPVKAEQMAKSAGTTVGGPRPVKKAS